MKIEAIQGPNINQPTGAKASEPAPVTARDRAIAALIKGAESAPQIPVQNPSQVAPEEYTAVQRSISRPEIPKQQDTIENATSTAEAEPKPTEEALSNHYAVLARKEKAIRQREQQLRQREAAIKAQDDALKAKPPTPTFDESKYVQKDALKQDPFKILSDLGLTYDQLTELAMNAPRPEQLALLNEIKGLKEEMQAMKGETKKSFEEREELQRTQAITQIRNEVTALVRQDPQFETVRATGSVGDVVELIEKVYDQDGILLTVEDAAQQVEEYLIDEAIKLAKLKKVQQRLQPKAPPQTAAQTKTTGQPEKKPMQTLTNSIASSRQLSARDRAIAAFKGELK